MNKIIIIDGYSLFFRSFYATYNYEDKTRVMRNKDGVATNAIFAFSNMIASLIKDLNKDDAIFVALDSNKPTFRKSLYPEYKANRKEIEDDLKIQFPILREFLDSISLPHYEKEGLEADDIAGIIAKMMEKENYEVFIYTSDKDYLQLIDNKITIKLIKKGLSNIVEMTPISFLNEYGFSPIQIIDYKALRGDPSDNLPGIPKIGDIVAKNLIKEFGTFENIVKHADTTKKVGQNIIEYQENGRLCYQLAKIKLDEPLPIKKEDLIYKGYDFNSLNNFSSKYSLKNLLLKMPSKFRIVKEINKLEYIKVNSTFDINFNDFISISININDTNYHYANLIGLSFYTNNKNYYIEKEDLLKDTKLLDILRNEKIKKYSYDFKKVNIVLSNNNIEINGLYFDLLLGAYLINPSITSSFSSILSYFSIDISFLDNEESLFSINNELISIYEAYYSYNLYQTIYEKLSSFEMLNLLNKIEIPFTLTLIEVEKNGFPLDKETLLNFENKYKEKLSSIEKAIYYLSNKTFNISSPKQLAEVLYDDLKIKQINKSRSTKEDILLKLMDESPLIPLILEYRKYSKLLNTYVLGYLPYINEDSLIHPTFNQTLTQTGRLSCSEPNLQNLSIKDEESKLIRKSFFYKDNSYMLSLDYSQIELRILAHLSSSKKMIDVFNNDLDIHSETAKLIFKLNRDPSIKERRIAKAVNFGIVYGISDWGLSEELNISISEAKEIISNFYNEFNEVKEYLDNLVEFAMEKGYTKTIFNRRRYFPNINSNNYQEREFEKRAAMNAPIQGSAADLIKLAMINVSSFLKNNSLNSKIINQIHDEIILKVPEDELEFVYKNVKNIMENSIKLKVKLVANGGYAKNRYDIK